MNKGEYKVVQGDVTEPEVKENIIIVQVCNDRGGYGSGVSGAIERKFPGTKDAYKRFVDIYRDGPSFISPLGKVSVFEYDDNITIANMIAQHNYKPYVEKPIRYAALVNCMEFVALMAKQQNSSIVAPKFGSDLAGGTWQFIEELIEEIWINQGIDVTIYEWVG